MGATGLAAARGAALPATMRSSPSIRRIDAVRREAGGDGGKPVAFLHAQLGKPAHHRRAVARTRPPRRGSDIRRSSTARAPPAHRRREARSPARGVSATSSPPSFRRVLIARSRPPSPRRVDQPDAQRIDHHAFEIDVGPGHDERRNQRKAAEDGSAGSTIGRGVSPGSPPPRVIAAMSPCGSTRTSAPK